MAVSRYLLAVSVGGLMAAVVPAAAWGQTGSVTGRVVDSTSQTGLGNATIRVEGTQRGALTRDDGTFVLTAVPAGAYRITASRIGFAAQTQSVTVTNGGSASATFSLHALAASLSEVVVVGYGTQRKNAITGSVTQVDATQANVGVAPNVNNLIQGRAAGVSITLNNGEPGAGAQVRIRGGTSISASNEPLYVIDGVPIANTQTETMGIGIGGGAALPRSPLNLLNPSDIANITILKDAAATAIYGSRAANGVVLIETKKGNSGAADIEYDGYYGVSMAASQLNVLNGNEYRDFIKQQVAAGNLTSDRLTSQGTANTNWEDALTRSAAAQNHNVSFSGGTDATRYRASLNYLNQNGVVLANGLQRYSGRLNGTTRAFKDKLQLGLNLTSSQVQNKYLAFENNGGFEGGVFVNMVNFNPTRPITVVDTTTGLSKYYELGTGAQSVRNPVALANQINDRAVTSRTLGNVTGSYTILPSLTASANIGVDKSSGLRRTYFPRASPVGAGTNGDARQAERDLSTATAQTLLTFNHPFGDLTTEVVGGYEYSTTKLGEFGAEARNFTTDAFSFNALGAGSTQVNPFSSAEQRVLSSTFGRANLGWKDRYFVTGVVRRDGSSVFGVNNKYAVFPAISGSWRISEESFMKGGVFSDLKLRGGYGLQGNQAISPYNTLTLLGADNGARYVFGSSVITGIVSTQNANPDLKWEQTAQTNIALDYGLLEGRLSGSLEYYVKNTRDLLLTVNVPQPAPVSTQIQNIGKVRNRGFEGSLDATLWERPSRSWTAGLVLSVDRNTVVNLGKSQFITSGAVSGQGQSGQNALRLIPGQPLGTFFGPEFAGVNAQGQQLFNKYTVTRDSAGVETSRKLNGTTTAPGGDDNVILGNANPKFTTGLRSNLNWGHFDGSFLLRAQVGAKVFNNTALVYATKGNVLQDKNFLKSALTDGIGIKEPGIYSSRYIENGDFLRLQNVTLGYTLNFRAGGPARPRSARIYVSGDNLFLITPYSGYDPEVFADVGLASRGIDYLSYPRARTFTSGIHLAF